MNANMENTLYGKLPAVAGLNRVQGFDPRKFMRKVVSEQTKQEIFYLDLKFKKLWFRLACPKGRIKTTALKITEQLAIIEAKVYFDRNDKEPAASFIAQRNAKDIPGTLYIETAQYAAVDQALLDAGFGLQFADMGIPADSEQYDAGIPVTDVNAAMKTPEAEPVTPEAVPREEPIAQVSVQPEPALEAAVVRAGIVHQETANAEAAPIQVDTAQPPAEELAEGENAVGYSADMAVDDICRLMTVEEAQNYIVDTGSCKGWTLAKVAQKRSVILKFYLNGYQGDNNILRAGAKLLLEQMQMAR